MIVERGPALPAASVCYRSIGPFETDTIPPGLLNVHRLKPDVWGVLRIVAGSIGFCWDDRAGGRRELQAQAAMLIPPEVPHHLEPDGAVTLTVEFWTEPA